ncbi:unnamed protein product [Mycena citricolor]|uniref:Galactose oxidase n=1 Tax=Mycena citricolor TaxID=2018698 RepID=A0AAD2HIR9_9AGAR|nr:unnamed protein product [Mycena citricolor]
MPGAASLVASASRSARLTWLFRIAHTYAACLLPPSIFAAVSADSVPPFQWLNITSLLQGPNQPPGLMDAAMAYDETSRTLIIFGGLASSGVPQAETYLLNLDSLTWSVPSPPTTLTRTPPARSAAVAGHDSAASNRDGFVVIGGMASDGSALSDVWEYDFNNQFWSPVNISPGGPSSRFGASGGIDTRLQPISDPVLPGPNNTFWLYGGSDGSTTYNDVWRLNISGTLSSNLPDSAVGTWEQINIATAPGRIRQGGGVLGNDIVVSGGCNGTRVSGQSCAVQGSYVIDGATGNPATPPSEKAALNCPAPRLSPTVIPNGNSNSTGFHAQMLVLLGVYNTSVWNDGNGLEHGEIAVLDINTQSWTRVVPAGDPGSSGQPSFPGPREGASAVMYPQALVGDADNRKSASDIIIFGGRDSSGNYLSELWILRAYNGVSSVSAPGWAGSGNGPLETGVNANGAGVQNTFITSCASLIPPNITTVTSSSSSSSSSVSSHSSSSSSSLSHSTSSATPTSTGKAKVAPHVTLDAGVLHKTLSSVSVALLLPWVLLFRHASPFYNTKNAAKPIWRYLAYALSGGVYGLGLGGLILSFTTSSSSHGLKPSTLGTTHGRAGIILFIFTYTAFLILHMCHGPAAPAILEDEKKPSTPPPLSRSVGPSSWRKRIDSLDSGSAESTLHRGFEVTNRPRRTRPSLDALAEHPGPTPEPLPASGLPSSSSLALRMFCQASLLAISIFLLVSLWTMAPRAAFGGFLAWTVLFYAILVTCSWRGVPDGSTLTLLFRRIRTEPLPSAEAPRPSVSDEGGSLPYLHQPAYRRAFPSATAGPTSSESDYDEDDDRAENEMRRRDISITSYPKRALRITNPS